MSDARFSKAFVTPTKCLRIIDDVLDELTCIKRVFQDQLQVWEKVHSGNKSCVVCNGCATSQEIEREEETGGEAASQGEKRDKCLTNALPRRSLELTMRLEEDALKVRESASICPVKTAQPTEFIADNEQVVTLLTLLQGEASTENSLRASEQSKILAVFTVVTVIFVRNCPDRMCICRPKDLLTKKAPLSWLTSLFAVEVKGFPSPWTMKDVGLGSCMSR